MYTFDYHRPAERQARRRRFSPRRTTQGARRRPDPHPGDEAAARERRQRSSILAASRISRHRRQRQGRRHRRDDTPRAGCELARRAEGDPALADLAEQIGDPQVRNQRHDRRLAREQRSGRRLSGGVPRARRHDHHQQAQDRGRRLLQGHVRDRARPATRSSPQVSFPVPKRARYAKFRTRRRASRWSACSSPIIGK